jgi:hypothetical protein
MNDKDKVVMAGGFIVFIGIIGMVVVFATLDSGTTVYAHWLKIFGYVTAGGASLIIFRCLQLHKG